MERYNVVLADDLSGSRTVLRRFINSTPDFVVIGEAEDGEALIEQVLVKKPHLALVDISMPKLSGISAIKQCLLQQPDLKVIFVTNYEQYAVEAFDVSAIDYIVKPVQVARLRQALDKVKTALQASVQRPRISRLLVRAEGVIRFVPLEEILFIEKIGRRTVIHTRAGLFDIQATLQTLLQQLNESFVLSHRSYIVNLPHISSIVSSGETYMAYFGDYDKPAHVSKHKYMELLKLAESR